MKLFKKHKRADLDKEITVEIANNRALCDALYVPMIVEYLPDRKLDYYKNLELYKFFKTKEYDAYSKYKDSIRSTKILKDERDGLINIMKKYPNDDIVTESFILKLKSCYENLELNFSFDYEYYIPPKILENLKDYEVYVEDNTFLTGYGSLIGNDMNSQYQPAPPFLIYQTSIFKKEPLTTYIFKPIWYNNRAYFIIAGHWNFNNNTYSIF